MAMQKKRPSMNWRIVLTVVIGGGMIMFNDIYNAARGPIEAKIAVGQLKDDAAAYALSREAATGNLIPRVVNYGGFGIIVLLWGTFLIPLVKNAANPSSN